MFTFSGGYATIPLIRDVVSAVSPERIEKKLADKVINADLYNEHKNK
ncbi:MAG: hypothetical protein IJ100_11545 [Lachnospiraceae bacterium]|nr:hypothetical protein [Lachnospiraceae bacterium]